MNLDINLNIAVKSERGDIITLLLRQLLEKVNHMSQALDDLTAKVEAEGTVIASAILLLEGIKAALDEAIAGGDTEALQALSDHIGADTQALADPVAANTPPPSNPIRATPPCLNPGLTHFGRSTLARP